MCQGRVFLPLCAGGAQPDIHSGRHEPYEAAAVLPLYGCGLPDLEPAPGIAGGFYGRSLGAHRVSGRRVRPRDADCAGNQRGERRSLAAGEPEQPDKRRKL